MQNELKYSLRRIRIRIIRYLVSKKLIKRSFKSSYPYISGDSFRACSIHIYDEIEELNPKKVNFKDIVFVKSDLLEKYFKTINPLINCKYILITHNSDANIDKKISNYIDEKIIRWYAQNVQVSHNTISPLPIGLENLHHYQNGRVDLFDNYKDLCIEKSNTILFGFNVHTNPLERQKALDALEAHSCAVKINKWCGPEAYLDTLSRHKFVASPEGNGIDCHRTWEAIYLGVVPIVTRTVLSEYFYDLGLPILLITDWGELNDIDEKYLNQFYTKHLNRFSSEYIWADAWLDCISSGNDPLSKLN
jgi:hypothetical protein